MNEQNTDAYFIYATDVLSDIKDQCFRQKQRIIALTEQLIQSKDCSYISEIASCFAIKDFCSFQLEEAGKKFMYLEYFDADMRRLDIICQILLEEWKQPGSRLFFLEQVETFDDLMQKYIRIKFFLHRLEFSLPETALQESFAMLMEEQVSVHAIFKILDNEVFSNKEGKYREALKIKKLGEILRK